MAIGIRQVSPCQSTDRVDSNYLHLKLMAMHIRLQFGSGFRKNAVNSQLRGQLTLSDSKRFVMRLHCQMIKQRI